MKKIFLPIIIITATISAHAQQVSESVSIKAGESIADAFTPNGYMRFAQFTEGTAQLKNGVKTNARFNYNLVSNEILFINGKGDTMAIAAPEDLKFVAIGEQTAFIYNNKSYLEILAEGPKARLAKKIKVVIEKDKKGGYGTSAPTSSQDQFENFFTGTQVFKLSHDVIVLKTTSFYWVDEYNNPQPANKRNSLRLVPKDKQSRLEAFIEQNKTDFNSVDDLRKLLAYAGTL
jgi:hypothetical protein